jgi:cobalt-zinc-cadmium efflux system protein
LAWTLGLVSLYAVAEVIGGLLSGSLALLADAGHMVSDAGALALALFAIRMSQRASTPALTFGYHRTEILAALANGLTLVGISVFILIEAWDRFKDPPVVEGAMMTWVAMGGLVINLVGLAILHSGRDTSLNMRGAWLHVASDALGSIQAIVAGILITAYGWTWTDSLASVLIALLIVRSAWSLLRASVNVLMEGTPSHLDATQVQASMESVSGVHTVHDLHIWTITSGFIALSAHARVLDRNQDDVRRDLVALLRERFGIDHTTIQLEGDLDCEESCSPSIRSSVPGAEGAPVSTVPRRRPD